MLSAGQWDAPQPSGPAELPAGPACSCAGAAWVAREPPAHRGGGHGGCRVPAPALALHPTLRFIAGLKGKGEMLGII